MKKFFKKFLFFVLLFLVIMYFIGLCTERPEYKPKEENNIPVYTELTPEEYQRRMDELINKPPVTKTSFKSSILQAHASSVKETYEKFVEFTSFFSPDELLDNWFSGYNDIKDYFSGNESYPVDPVEPKESVTIPFQYEFYGKNRVVYNNGTYEIITCKIMTSDSVSTKKKTGVVRYTRTNSYGDYTSFSFEISAYKIVRTFSATEGFNIQFYGLKSYMSGLTSNFIEKYLTSMHRAYFVGSSTNSLKQFNINSSDTVSIDKICYNGLGNACPNHFSISSTSSNDYEFSQSINDYYNKFNCWHFPNVYYNNKAGNTVTQNNVENYSQYGYTYNNVTNSIEFDPNVYADFFDLNIKPKLKAEFEAIFSHFPDIDATYSDDNTNIHYNDLVEIIKQIQQPTETTVTTAVTSTYPVATGNVNVNVEVTFPAEFYKTYPPLNTEPAFVAENPDVDFALDSPLPVRALEVSGGLITLSSNFIEDAGLMPVVLMGIALGLVVMFFL